MPLGLDARSRAINSAVLKGMDIASKPCEDANRISGLTAQGGSDID
jgi:hypothetical protein